MSLPDSAEYWQDVKRLYVGQNYFCIPDCDCGYRHHFYAKYIDDVNCRGCKRKLKEGFVHNLLSAEQHKIDKQKKLQSKINNVKSKLLNKYPNNPICECGFVMIERTNKANGNKFYGCSQYPNCKKTQPIKQ